MKVSSFWNTLTMRIVLFLKIFKIWCTFKFSQCWTGYLPSAVNLLKKNTKTSRNSRGDIFGIIFPEKDQKTWQKRSHGGLASIWNAYTCCLSKRVLKRRFLESGLTKTFTVSSFGNTLAMRIIPFFKMFKIWCRFQKWNTKMSRNVSFLG